MLHGNQKQAVAKAWLERCLADEELRVIKHECNSQCRGYFSQPTSLIWPFAAGVLLTRFNRAAPQAIKASSLVLSIAQLVARAAPLARRWIQ